MLSRNALRGVTRPHTATSSHLSAVRQLSYASLRPSAAALGKRPALAYTSPASSLAVQSRNISWTPWRPATPPAAPLDETITSSSASAVTQTNTPDPILIDSHTDLSSSSNSPTEPIASSSSLPEFPADSSLLPQPPADGVTPTLADLILNSGKPLEEVLNSPEAVHAAMQVSDMKLLGYEHGFFSISGWFTDAIVGLHTTTGLPWWATIASITVAIRLALSPILISTQKHNVRLAAVNPQIQGLMERVKEAKEKNDIHAQALIGQAMRQLMKDHNVNPMRALLLPAIQLPIFLTFFNIVRGLANLPLPQLKEGGIGWVTDLTMADPYYILPLTSLLFTNLVFKYGADGMGAAQKSQSPERTAHIKNFIQMTTFASLPIVSYFPAAILFYWTFSTGFTLLQSVILRQQVVKTLLGIPTPPVVPPPPGQKEFKNPNWLDTIKAAKDFVEGNYQKASIMSEERQVELAREQALLSKNRMHAPVKPVERIRESTPAAATASPSAPAETTAHSSSGRPLSPREAEKQRRVAAARRKRAGQ
ncbi:uncharacterized protein I303_108444 [Kwoniella dejecticola CBS 10117]|uniref:Membrane insertase YidC/Oxa/ALB C-terminal domain-containing protein n=1 Tax=Kwoniella dejecticola CBS 10117 TaxID=1296121 RepID=A0A1A5ZXD8_9TREE|nr:uncharacterized protein I303_07231 [Kwoniella dejecticola CBS 10117]OBR82471.1 hypothetical protein I303_07231 [Kwoniella dejecticola CBS 10117]